MDKHGLSERDICTKFITPALRKAGWDQMLQIREEVGFTKGRIIVRGKMVLRGKAKRADYVLYYKPNISLALIEAKDNSHSVGDGIQQGLDYAATLDIPFVFSSNGDGSCSTTAPAAAFRTTAETRCRLLDALLAEALAPVEERELEAAE
jgi:type I restriction enzyme R subunit